MANILVIDDDEIVREMIVELLTNAGFHAEGASDGKAGMSLFARRAFDLIVTDLVMPEQEGIETIFAIRAANKAVPIIAISGGGKISPDKYLQMAKQCGANHLFRKPFDNREFLATVRECLS